MTWSRVGTYCGYLLVNFIPIQWLCHLFRSRWMELNRVKRRSRRQKHKKTGLHRRGDQQLSSKRNRWEQTVKRNKMTIKKRSCVPTESAMIFLYCYIRGATVYGTLLLWNTGLKTLGWFWWKINGVSSTASACKQQNQLQEDMYRATIELTTGPGFINMQTRKSGLLYFWHDRRFNPPAPSFPSCEF